MAVEIEVGMLNSRRKWTDFFSYVKENLYDHQDVRLFARGVLFATVKESKEFIYLNDDVYDRDDFRAFCYDLRACYLELFKILTHQDDEQKHNKKDVRQ